MVLSLRARVKIRSHFIKLVFLWQIITFYAPYDITRPVFHKESFPGTFKVVGGEKSEKKLEKNDIF